MDVFDATINSMENRIMGHIRACFDGTTISTINPLAWSDPKIPRVRQPRNYVL